MRPLYTGPKLPVALLENVASRDHISPGRRENPHRRDKRRFESHRTASTLLCGGQSRNKRVGSSLKDGGSAPKRGRLLPASSDAQLERQVRREPKPVKSILKKSRSTNDMEDKSHLSAAENESTVPPKVKQRLAEDDAEIAALEKKLNIKNKRSKVAEEDGLDWLAKGDDSNGEDSGYTGTKRKRPEDDRWLKDKRRKATSGATRGGSVEAEDESDDAGVDESSGGEMSSDEDATGLENPFSEDEVDSDDFEDFEASEGDDQPLPSTRQRENPYVPPISATTVTTEKYVPPSLRKAPPEEDLRQLKRQMQGQFNRLSETNFLSILQSIEQAYEKNARHHASSTMADLLVGLVSDSAILNETFLILHAGFATAVYKVIGVDFGALLLEKIVQAIDDSIASQSERGKQCLNLIGFLSNLYVFQMIGSALIFDYVRIFLSELTENNTELLLRVLRSCGLQLRQDDPSSLRDVVLLLTRSVASVGEAKLSVRAKYMVETIQDLKNNRMKTSANTSTAVHVVRIRKSLGSLNARPVRASEPLQLSLRDINNGEKQGKWWLIGAMYQPKRSKTKFDEEDGTETSMVAVDDAGDQSETPDHVSLQKLAKIQGMNTDIRRAIFVAILSAADYRDAHMRMMKLRLKGKQEIEIPRVLLHCAGAETTYNPYYTLIAKKLCGENKMKKAFQFALWDVLRKIGDAGENNLDKGDSDHMSTMTIVNLARLYGTLIANGSSSITSLKVLDFALLETPAKAFAQVLLTTIMLETKDRLFERAIKEVFVQAAAAPQMIQGLKLFLENDVARAEVTYGSKEKKIVRRGCGVAVKALDGGGVDMTVDEDGDST